MRVGFGRQLTIAPLTNHVAADAVRFLHVAGTHLFKAIGL